MQVTVRQIKNGYIVSLPRLPGGTLGTASADQYCADLAAVQAVLVSFFTPPTQAGTASK